MTNESEAGKLPEVGFVRARQLVYCPASGGKPERRGILSISKTTLWKLVKLGKFPKPVKLSEGVTAWRVEDVRAYLAGQQFPT